MGGVVLVFRDVSEDRKLGHLEERDARTLGQDLLAGPSLAGLRVSPRLLAAADRDDSGGASVDVLLASAYWCPISAADELLVIVEEHEAAGVLSPGNAKAA